MLVNDDADDNGGDAENDSSVPQTLTRASPCRAAASERDPSRETPSLHGRNVLLGVTGSVAAIRTPKLISLLREAGASVEVVVTSAATTFLEAEEQMPCDITVHTDEAEWRKWKQKGDPVLHIELRKWAHLFLIAPLSANSLAKMSVGICDNLLLSVARAWRPGGGGKPFYVAPAMNSEMWAHPVTEGQLRTLQRWGVNVVMPIEKKLACGDYGTGAMEEPLRIVEDIAKQQWTANQ